MSKYQILIGILEEGRSEAAKALLRYGINLNLLRTEFQRNEPNRNRRDADPNSFSPAAKRALAAAYKLAGEKGLGVSNNLLCLATLEDCLHNSDDLLGKSLFNRGIDTAAIVKELSTKGKADECK